MKRQQEFSSKQIAMVKQRQRGPIQPSLPESERYILRYSAMFTMLLRAWGEMLFAPPLGLIRPLTTPQVIIQSYKMRYANLYDARAKLHSKVNRVRPHEVRPAPKLG